LGDVGLGGFESNRGFRKIQNGAEKMNQEKIETITINNVEYVRKEHAQVSAQKVDGLDYCIVRTYSAGVFAGYVKMFEGKDVTLIDARRLWYWKGAASLSQLAVDGVSCPDECRFPVAVPIIHLTEAIEVIPCSAKSKLSIDSVAIWGK